MGSGGNEPSENEKRTFNRVLCRIKINNSYLGNGFLCKVPYPIKSHLFPVLITNKILNKSDICKKNSFKIYLGKQEEEKELVYYDERKIFISKKYGIVFIEIFPYKDNINTFLELNEENDEIREGKEINIHQYNDDKEIKIFKGKIKEIKEFEFKHNCSIKGKILGFPIFSLNHKVIGVIKDKNNYEYGDLLIKPLEEFREELKNRICDIKVDNFLLNGFFCRIHFPDKSVGVLITKYHSLENVEKIKIFFDKKREKRTMKLSQKRKLYHEERNNILIIEILDEDNLNNFFDINIDSTINKDDMIYILKNESPFPYGNINYVSKHNIKYNLQTLETNENITEGNPIISLKNFEPI